MFSFFILVSVSCGKTHSDTMKRYTVVTYNKKVRTLLRNISSQNYK